MADDGVVYQTGVGTVRATKWSDGETTYEMWDELPPRSYLVFGKIRDRSHLSSETVVVPLGEWVIATYPDGHGTLSLRVMDPDG